ncbi:helix-turn-helix transcriptional regulator [Actinokineospora diospyrosa]|uniref:DNA-binding transcriptional regulator YafY, contains an HTH and WYL domains n=1 Tax=Actinokineospora diospyrosa TaxID=103728 RepID=A0ABT1IA94_9PSEU|nr:WYL domain-containing protein [Actinokineospora diospyrosa]MCP2269466.1 putative DNA-binding transcriptional regulator YafY, contains an HTH and WYL domains [Actinokineospora diospyrosa]
MSETSARLLSLLGLLQARLDWTGHELADRLSVSPRTVRRDVERLRDLGYPVNATGGVGGGYQLGVGARLPPLLLDDDEAVAVAVGLRTAAAVTGIEEISARALAKLDHVLPERLRRQVATIAAAMVTTAGPGAEVDTTTLAAIAAAVRDHHRLRFDYGTEQRDVEPYRLVHSGRRWYLLAWDTGRGDWRTFRVDRLTPRTPTGPRFAPRDLPEQDVGRYFVRSMTTTRFRYRARLTMHAPATEVADEVPPTIGLVEPVDAETCTLRLGSDSLDQLAVWVAAFGFEFEVHEPPELRSHLRELTARLGRAADRG